MSYTWRSILKASWIIKKGCYWTIGSGEDVDIWQDNWIHQKGNSNTWSLKPDQATYQKVKDIMNPHSNSWNEPLINQLFIPIEAKMICQIPIIDKTQHDALTWDGTLDGNYSVKSGYQAIMNWVESTTTNTTSSSAMSNNIWQILWKLNVPPKHSHFIWRLLNEALPVKGNLFKKGIRCDPLCPRCSNHVETSHHVFLDCVWAKQVWFASSLTINLNGCHFENLNDWVLHMFNQTDQASKELIAATLYGIWYARNLLVFQEKNLPPNDVSHIAFAQLQEFQSHNIKTQNAIKRTLSTGSSSNNTRWNPPPRGILKINVDAHLSSDGHWFS
ncbi:hypothetical protein TSUD_98410 [Trifolium subterraneum]|uniref:Reverse transcriptase zinc-binding domain-containing protein n=1 Tax=Trifolium subterraneum TaxID=3900 RepID=A0A2Z6NZN3_TRISU|nr:hypothetical protein TSUD_98410 [Trifolium subterraneum]